MGENIFHGTVHEVDRFPLTGF
uniref:Uncharacterized protein n=1 Tax=Anguilla anguilla TaxID=7936 RepID=A0A0E9XDN2_ANGAN